MSKLLSKLKGLLSDPEFNFGLLAQPVHGTQGLVQAIGRSGLSAFGTQEERLRNQILRARLVEEERKRALMKQLPDLLGNTTIQGPGQNITAPAFGDQEATQFLIPGKQARVPIQATPAGQAQLRGLLAQIAPEETARGLLAQFNPQQERAEPAAIREFRTFFPGLDPGTPEGREAFIQFQAQKNPGSDLDTVVKQAALQLNMMQLRQAEREEQEKQKSKQQAFATGETALNRGLAVLAEAARLNEKLAPTFLAAGGLGVDLRAKSTLVLSEVKELFGSSFIDREGRQIVDDFNRFKKLTSELIIESIGRVAGAGTGTATNQRMQLLSASMAGIGSTPGTNALIFADSIEGLFDTAEIEGFTVRQRDSLNDLIRKLRIVTPGQSIQPIDIGGGGTLEITGG